MAPVAFCKRPPRATSSISNIRWNEFSAYWVHNLAALFVFMRDGRNNQAASDALDKSNCCSFDAGTAGLNRYPCISLQPKPRSISRCISVSTPSAVVVIRHADAMFTTASTIVPQSSGWLSSRCVNEALLQILENPIYSLKRIGH
jgi:hypothetical protein